ncbi:hypothetical protein KDL01_00975 [Actinospica durhamensis]|uniref:DNA-binding protein n=1 Tax=Actinospica durhamensis TaxID=1508375 RepID=A0A941IKG6_9ACTN|nr:hypothetical protein [Actinospica durhamensis]MBR7831810.1 hypothetical protein [Actinospica durhamensis]
MSQRYDSDALPATGEVALVDGGIPDRADTLSARAYAHPLLDGRVVVRLTPEALGGAEDLTMDFLGFDAPSAIDAVGVVRQQALGFPAWALVNDPANAQHALSLVKDIERCSRVAKSKPGHAKDGFDALAERLAGSVPRYLPPFSEQVARIFLGLDNTFWAALYFDKARGAEHAYGLPIDEDVQAASFLEFALAGALTAKALTAYARDLALRRTPAEAYARYRQVCVERVKGGLPPFAAMPADLRRLAKAAKLDPSAAEQDLLRELLVCPAITRSSGNFWSTYRDAIGALGRAEPAVRGLLLNMTPVLAGTTELRGDLLWLSILAAAGATEDLTAPAASVPAEASVRDGAAGWLGRFVRTFESSCGYFRAAPPAELLDLVERMADRLRDEGVAVALGARPHLSLELIDLCLARQIPVADPPPELELNAGHLSAQCSNCGRDLNALVADERFRPMLDVAVGSVLRASQQYSTQWTQPAGIRALLAERLDDLARSILEGGLPDAERGLGLLSRLRPELGPVLCSINPQAWERITAFDAAVPLADVLRRGIFDELGWPALEEAAALLAPPIKTGNSMPRLRVLDQWPYLIVSDDQRVVVVGHDRILHTQDVSPLAQGRFGSFQFGWANGQLSITVSAFDNPTVTWSGSPHAPLATDISRGGSISGSIELADGARSFGARPYRAGDTACKWRGPVATDGERHWVLKRGTDENKWISALDEQWREFDPFNGRVGAPGTPEFLAEVDTPAAAQLNHEACSLLKLPEGVEDSPLGSAGGLVGWRATLAEDGTQRGTGIDGRSVSSERRLATLEDEGRPAIVGAIRFPGAAQDLAIVWHFARFHQTSHKITLLAPGDGSVARFAIGERSPVLARGTACLPPWKFWHYFRPRDPAGSAALRGIEVSTARALIAAGAEADLDKRVALIAQAIPEITSDQLLAGIVGYATNARYCAGLVAKIKEAATAEPAQSALATHAAAMRAKADETVAILSWVRDPEASALPEGAIAAGSVFGRSRPNFPSAVLSRLGGDSEELSGWEHFADWTGMRGDLYLAAVAPWFGRKHSQVFDRAEELRASGLLELAERIRVLNITPPAPQSTVEVIASEAGHVVAFKRRSYNETAAALTDWEAVEIRRADRGFGAIPGWGIKRWWRVSAWPWSETPPAEAARMLAERGEIPWDPQYAERLAEAAGISRGEAAVWLLGVPGLSYRGVETLAPELLKRFGFATATAWQVAVRRFLRLFGQTSDILGVLVPERAEDLWSTGPDIQRAAAYWVARFGHQASAPPALLEAADKELRHERSYNSAEPVVVLRDLLDSAGQARIRDNKQAYTRDWEVIARTLLWLAYRLPVGDPLRAQLPQAVTTVRTVLLEPGRDYPVWYAGGADAAATVLGLPVRQEGVRKAVGPLSFGDKGLPVLRPNLLSSLDDPALDLVSGAIPYGTQVNPAHVLRLLLGEGLPRLFAEDPAAVEAAGAQAYQAQDPTRSVPELVAQVAAERNLSADAAALYLMLLALPDPTERNQAAWTGWKPPRLKAARAELAERADLLVSGTRPRAGRSLFLPGPWIALKVPYLPVEAWKAASLGIEADGTVPLGVVLPQVPVPELFHAAWQRVSAGDAPSFEYLTSGTAR